METARRTRSYDTRFWFHHIIDLSVDTAILRSHAGSLLKCTAGPHTHTLPTLTAEEDGKSFFFFNNTTSTIHLDGTINGIAGGFDITAQYEYALVTWDAAAVSYIVSTNGNGSATGDTCGLGIVKSLVIPDIADGDSPDLTIPHGLGYQPSTGIFEVMSDLLVRWQPTRLDNTNAYVNVSGPGVVANLKLLAPCNCDGGTPEITSFSPVDATEGDVGFTLTVNGVNFRADSVVYWNGSPRVTTYVSQLELTVAILTADLVTAGEVEVSVFNPGAGCGMSDAVAFDIYHYESGTGAFEIARGGTIPDTFVGGYSSPENIASGGGAPFLMAVAKHIKDIKVTTDASSGGSDLVDLQFCKAVDLAHFDFTFPPLVRLETPLGLAVLNNNTVGVITGFGEIDLAPVGWYYALRMILSGGPGGASRKVIKIEYRWK